MLNTLIYTYILNSWNIREQIMLEIKWENVTLCRIKIFLLPNNLLKIFHKKKNGSNTVIVSQLVLYRSLWEFELKNHESSFPEKYKYEMCIYTQNYWYNFRDSWAPEHLYTYLNIWDTCIHPKSPDCNLLLSLRTYIII